MGDAHDCHPRFFAVAAYPCSRGRDLHLSLAHSEMAVGVITHVESGDDVSEVVDSELDKLISLDFVSCVHVYTNKYVCILEPFGLKVSDLVLTHPPTTIGTGRSRLQTYAAQTVPECNHSQINSDK